MQGDGALSCHHAPVIGMLRILPAELERAYQFAGAVGEIVRIALRPRVHAASSFDDDRESVGNSGACNLPPARGSCDAIDLGAKSASRPEAEGANWSSPEIVREDYNWPSM